MGFNSIDDFIASVSAGKFWRQDFMKLQSPAAAVAGCWWDIQQGGGTPCEYLHGNYIQNYSFVAGTDPWVYTLGANWTYVPGTHSMTRTANADGLTLSQNTKCVYGQSYYVTISCTWTAGSFGISLGGTAGTPITGAGVLRQVIVCGATANAPFVITPNATAAGTALDLVSIQPIVGTFVPYNDLTEGALWHGGDVSAETKHLVNWGAWANFATGLPIVLMLVDVLGVYPRVLTDTANLQILSATDIEGGGALMEDTQDAWNEQVVGGVTASVVVKATEVITGGSANASCCKFAITDVFATGIMCSELVSVGLYPANPSYPKARYVYFWIRSSTNLAAGDLSFCTDESASLASSQDTLLPAITANTWTRVRLDVSGVATTDRDTVISIGIKAINDKNLTYNLYIDDVRWTLPDGVCANGNFYGNSTGWTEGAGWAYRSYDDERTAGAVTNLSQANVPIVAKVPYSVTYTVANRSAGGVTVSLGGAAGTQRVLDGTYTQILTPLAGDTTGLVFTPDADFNGRISHVIIYPKFPRCDEGTVSFGDGVRMYYVLDNALTNGTGANNSVIKYTNSGALIGTAGRSLGATCGNLISTTQGHIPHSGPAILKYGPFLPLQAGDRGIQNVQSMQQSGVGSQAGGALDVVVCKPIASIPITTAYVAAERDLMNQLPSLPKIRDGACLMFITFNGGATAAASQFQGYCDFAWS